MRWLRTALLSSTALTALIAPGPATAAETAARWSGCYVGAQTGFVSGASDVSNALSSLPGRPGPDFSDLGTIRANTGLIGGHVGCNYQSGKTIIGGEGEFWWSGKASSITAPDSGLLISSPPGFAGFNLTLRSHWTESLSVRAGGVVFDRAFVYGRLGVAASQFDYQATAIAPYTGTASSSTTRAGLLMGLGVDYALTDRWSARFDYEFVDFGRATLSFNGTIGGPLVVGTGLGQLGVKEQMNLLKVGLSYKLF